MAEKHILSLEIPTVSNCEVLCVKDTSQYTTKLEVDCSELLIELLQANETIIAYNKIKSFFIFSCFIFKIIIPIIYRIH